MTLTKIVKNVIIYLLIAILRWHSASNRVRVVSIYVIIKLRINYIYAVFNDLFRREKRLKTIRLKTGMYFQ